MESPVLVAVRQWIARVVVELELCPFAARELARDSVRFVESCARDETALLQALEAELLLLERDTSIETTLVVHPEVLQDFHAFNQFLDEGERLLAEMGLLGVYQIASFHPHYQFAGTSPADAENYSNRSPWPVLHILREASVERAIAAHGDIDAVPARNIAVLNSLGTDRLRVLLRGCLDG